MCHLKKIVNALAELISITMCVSKTHGKLLSHHTFSLTDTATTTMNQLAIFLNKTRNDNFTACVNICGLRVY
jgi:hypothetical protein